MMTHALSRFTRRPVLAALAPGRVAVRDAGGHVRRAAPEGGVTGWREAVREFARLLEAPGARTGGVQVVISDHWVRLCVIPAEAGLDRADEQIAYARHAWRGEFGAAVDQWRARVDIDAHGSGVAALIDDALAGAIGEACRAAGLRLESLAPRFAAVQARLARRIAARDGWFCVLESGHATLARRGARGWTRIVGMRLAAEADLQAQLEARLAFENPAPDDGAPGLRVDVVAPPAQLARLRFGTPWQAGLWPDPLPLD